MKTKHLLFALLLSGLAWTGFAQTADGGKIAFLGLDNNSGDPRYSYLAPVMEGLLLFDLSDKGHLDLVERRQLQKILAEQEFQQSGLTGPASVKLGKLAGAQWLVYGGYSLVNGEILLDLKITDAGSGETSAFHERGATEHVVHWLAEKAIRKLSGKSLMIADSTNDRSLVSLRDETPASLAVHSKLIGGKIFIDGEFVGFTKGDERTPSVFDKLPPGRHTVRTWLADSFGVFELPGLKFKDWQVEVDLKPGRQTAIIDDSLSFYDALARLEKLDSFRRQYKAARPDTVLVDRTATYPLPSGAQRTIQYKLQPAKEADKAAVTVLVKTAGQTDQSLAFSLPWAKEGARQEKTFALPGMQLEVSMYVSGDSLTLTCDLTRTDLDPDTLGR